MRMRWAASRSQRSAAHGPAPVLVVEPLVLVLELVEPLLLELVEPLLLELVEPLLLLPDVAVDEPVAVLVEPPVPVAVAPPAPPPLVTVAVVAPPAPPAPPVPPAPPDPVIALRSMFEMSSHAAVVETSTSNEGTSRRRKVRFIASSNDSEARGQESWLSSGLNARSTGTVKRFSGVSLRAKSPCDRLYGGRHIPD
jgi:hypothetical protein